ncbi:hypothetical protein VYU27_002996 [Nannochloropsis oceanica]
MSGGSRGSRGLGARRSSRAINVNSILFQLPITESAAARNDSVVLRRYVGAQGCHASLPCPCQSSGRQPNAPHRSRQTNLVVYQG